MAQFTPEQIEEFLQEFFNVVGTRQYIGARYIPLFGRRGEQSIEWDNSAPYEPLTVVKYQGNSYTSRQYVPTGVGIDNADYWAETGNFNAQVEAYRQEVLALAGDVSDLKEIIPFERFSEHNTVYDLITANGIDTPNVLKQAYLGRLSQAPFGDKSPQGFCIVNNTGIFCFTDNTDCKFVYVNMTNGAYINTIDSQLGHCNCMCYNPETEKIYVVPNHIDNVKSNDMYVCNPFTMQIEQTVDLGFIGHSVAYDVKTGDMYVASETTIDGNYGIGVYTLDVSDMSTEYIGGFNTNPNLLGLTGYFSGTVGAQQLVCHDGDFYFLVGGHVNIIEHFDSELNFIDCINIDSECFIYTVVEAEGMQFNENGSIILWSQANNFCNRTVGLVSALMNGTAFDSYDTDLISDNYYRYSKCQENANGINANIYVTGSETKPFPELSEAISLAVRNGLDVVVYGNVTYEGARIDFSPAPIQILGSNGTCSITFKAGFNVNGHMRLEGANSTNKLKVKFDLSSATVAPLKNTMTTYFKNVEFDGTNCTNYIARLHGIAVATNCDFVNTDTLYSKYIDLQQLGIGVGQDVFNNAATIDAVIRA